MREVVEIETLQFPLAEPLHGVASVVEHLADQVGDRLQRQVRLRDPQLDPVDEIEAVLYLQLHQRFRGRLERRFRLIHLTLQVGRLKANLALHLLGDRPARRRRDQLLNLVFRFNE